MNPYPFSFARVLHTSAALLSIAMSLPSRAGVTESPAIPEKQQVWKNAEPWNDGWLYAAEEPAPASTAVVAIPKTEEGQWEQVTLPHTWNAADTLASEHYRLGVSWYRKHFTLTPEQVAAGERRILRIGAANQQGMIYVNGKLAGTHTGGYSAFTVDLTPFLVSGDNVVDARVDNRPSRTLIPTTDGLFNLYGGLYRGVELLHAPRLGFSRTYAGGPGVRVWSEQVSAASADVQVEALVDDASESEQPGSCQIEAVLSDAAGKTVSSVTRPASAKTRMALPNVNHPALWSPEHPALYTLTLRLMKGGEERDRVTVRHGFRFFEFTPDHGFLLNGAPYKLHGVNRHQDVRGKGNALLPEDHFKDLTLMKELGANWLRLAHYQQDDYVLQLCDELGILVWEEIPFVRENTLDPEFEQNAQGMLTDMIAQHFNHPAILLWGMGNEIYYSKGQDGRATNFGVISRLNDTIHREDPVRRSVIVNGDANNATDLKIMGIPDVIGYNLYQGWYGGKIEQLTPRMEDLHRRNPDKPMIISEFGAGCEIGKHADPPKAWDMSEEFQVYFLKEYLRQFDACPWLCGWNWWNFADFAWAKSSNPKLYNNKGLVSFDRRPKASFYALRERLTGKPAPAAEPPKPAGPATDPALPIGENANPFKGAPDSSKADPQAR